MVELLLQLNLVVPVAQTLTPMPSTLIAGLNGHTNADGSSTLQLHNDILQDTGQSWLSDIHQTSSDV